MNPSTFLSILFTISLIFISNAPLPASTIITFKLYENVCIQYDVGRQPEYLQTCLTALESDPRIPQAKTYYELSGLIIEQAIKNSTISQNILKEMAKSDLSPTIKECANEDYDGIIKAFNNALGIVRVKGNAQTAINYIRKDLGYAEGKCSDAVRDDPKPYFEVNVLISRLDFHTKIVELSLGHLMH